MDATLPENGIGSYLYIAVSLLVIIDWLQWDPRHLRDPPRGLWAAPQILHQLGVVRHSSQTAVQEK